jgi:hypothetical protein
VHKVNLEECKDLPLFVNRLASLRSGEGWGRGKVRSEYGIRRWRVISGEVKFGTALPSSQRRLFLGRTMSVRDRLGFRAGGLNPDVN